MLSLSATRAAAACHCPLQATALSDSIALVQTTVSEKLEQAARAENLDDVIRFAKLCVLPPPLPPCPRGRHRSCGCFRVQRRRHEVLYLGTIIARVHTLGSRWLFAAGVLMRTRMRCAQCAVRLRLGGAAR